MAGKRKVEGINPTGQLKSAGLLDNVLAQDVVAEKENTDFGYCQTASERPRPRLRSRRALNLSMRRSLRETKVLMQPQRRLWSLQ